MSNRTKDEINFVVGKGNQSAICGGVTPIKVVNPEPSIKSSEEKAPAKKSDRDR